MSQNIAKYIPYIINKLGGDFQQGGCLHKLTSGIHLTLKHQWPWISDRPQIQASVKLDQSSFGGGAVVFSYLVDGAINWL